MRGQGFPARVRVRRRADFERAYAEGNKRVGKWCVLFARANGLEFSRLGVTATRKIGNAVRRNRAKRLVREAFRQIQDMLPPGLDLVVVVRQSLLGPGSKDLQREILELTQRATS